MAATPTTIAGDYTSKHYYQRDNDFVRGVRPKNKDLIIGWLVTEASNNSDWVNVDLYNQFGIKRFLGIKGFGHTTEGSVIVTENPTTVCENGMLKITNGAVAGSGKIRVFMIVGV